MQVLTKRDFYRCYGSDNWSFIIASLDTGISSKMINETITKYQKACKAYPWLFLQPYELYEFALKPAITYIDIQKYWMKREGIFQEKEVEV